MGLFVNKTEIYRSGGNGHEYCTVLAKDEFSSREEAESCIPAAEGMYLGMDYAYVKEAEDH